MTNDPFGWMAKCRSLSANHFINGELTRIFCHTSSSSSCSFISICQAAHKVRNYD